MRRSWQVWAAGLLFVGSIVACVDLFHSTNVPTLCDLDADAPGCATDGGTAEAGLCAPEAGTAQVWAASACAWLSACENPVGANQAGLCLPNAILAYDCTANPSRPLHGKAAAFWTCMRGVRTCADVVRCVTPDAIVPGCTSGGFEGCTQNATNPDTLFDCITVDAGPPPAQNCSMMGQTCDSRDRDAAQNGGICTGVYGYACPSSSTSGCKATALTLCDENGIDRGYDCADFGAQNCDPTKVACVPLDLHLGPCPSGATNRVTCVNNLAQGCADDILEQVDCTALSGPGTCNTVDGGVGTAPADGCFLDGGCTTDECADGGALAACVRGRSVTIDCVGLGLRSCTILSTSNDGGGPSCAPPL